jgi:hypothetical protein
VIVSSFEPTSRRVKSLIDFAFVDEMRNLIYLDTPSIPILDAVAPRVDMRAGSEIVGKRLGCVGRHAQRRAIVEQGAAQLAFGTE